MSSDLTAANTEHRLRDSDLPGAARMGEAAKLISALIHADTLADFLTLPAYDLLA